MNKDKHDNSPSLQDDPTGENSPTATAAKVAQPIRITSGEVLLFSPPNITSRHRPCITLGRFRDGTWALHFRQYVRDDKSPNGIRISRDGASFTIDEAELGIAKARAMAALVPDAPVVRGGHKND